MENIEEDALRAVAFAAREVAATHNDGSAVIRHLNRMLEKLEYVTPSGRSPYIGARYRKTLHGTNNIDAERLRDL